MKVYGELKVHLHSFLTLPPHGNEWSASRLSGEKAPPPTSLGTHITCWQVGPTYFLEGWRKENAGDHS